MQKRITKDLLTYLPGKALPALAAFITVPIYTRLFTPDEFGKYALAVAAVEFLMLGTMTGFGQATVRFFSAYHLRHELSRYFTVVFGSVGVITLAIALASTGILLAFTPLIPSDLSPLLWTAVILYVVGAVNATLMDVLRGQEKSRLYSIFWISQVYLGIIFGLIFVLVFGMDISGLIWGQTIGLLLPIFPLVWITTRSIVIRPVQFNKTDFKQLWAFALPFTIGNIAFWSLSLADRYIVEFFRGSYDVGVYSVATKISARSIQMLVGLFFLVPAPLLSRLWEERGRQATEEALTAFTRAYFLMIIPAVSGLIVVAAPLLRLLADEAYFSGYPAIWFAALASLGLGLSDLASSGCMVTNRTGLIARNQGVAAGTCLLLNLILVPTFGFIGAALSAAVSFLLLAALQAVTSARFLTWRLPLKTLWRVLIASSAMSASVLLLLVEIRSDTTLWQVINLLLSILVGALIYGLVLWILGEITPSQILGFFRTDPQKMENNPIIGGPGSN